MNKHSFGKLAFALAISVFSTHSYTAHPGQLKEKPISLQVENLARWKNSREALAIEQGIRALLKPRPNYPRTTEPFEDAKKIQSLFKFPFLLLEAEPNGFGGFWAVIVFKGHPKVLSLWVYEIDKNVFEIREIEPLQVVLNAIIMDELKDKRIAPFWVTL
jgi:hypothetical protein